MKGNNENDKIKQNEMQLSGRIGIMKVLKKVGWFIVAMLPALLSLVLQIGCAVVVMVVYVLQEIAKAPGTVSYDYALEQAVYVYMDNAMYIVVLYQIIGLVIFGLWYYLAYGRKPRPSGAEKPDYKGVAAIIWLGIGMQFFITGILNIIYLLNPGIMESYMELMETAGITEFTLVTFIATVILAPLGEEILCRGIIFRIAGKVSGRFWVANCIQAFAFGVIHGNLVQGSYAFLIGLVLGYIYGKYHNIWYCMLLHGVINFTSNFIDFYFELFPEGYEVLVLIGNIIVSSLLILFCFKVLGKRKELPADAVLTVENVD